MTKRKRFPFLPPIRVNDSSCLSSCQRKMTLSKNSLAFCYSSKFYLRSFYYLVFHSSLWCYDLMGYFVIMDYCWHSFATVDECESSPCKNGASCKITQDGYSCQPCPAGWDGKNCDEGLMRLWINYLFGLGKSLTASSLVPFQRKVSSIVFFLREWIKILFVQTFSVAYGVSVPKYGICLCRSCGRYGKLSLN